MCAMYCDEENEEDVPEYPATILFYYQIKAMFHPIRAYNSVARFLMD